MKTLSLKPEELKTFIIGVGISVGFLTLSFVVNFYGETRDQIKSRISNPAPTAEEPVYTEIHGMN
jgi:hypothetical protein